MNRIETQTVAFKKCFPKPLSYINIPSSFLASKKALAYAGLTSSTVIG